MKKSIKIEEIKKLMKEALTIRGLDDYYSNFIINDYIEAELEEKPSHGLSKFLLIDEALSQVEGKLEIVKEYCNYAKINGHKQLGHISGLYCVDKAINLAKKHGNSIVALTNASRYSRIKPFAQKIAEEGYIGIIVNNGGPSAVTPYGSATPILGTNPICFSFPSNNSKSYIFDFSTSKKVWAEIRQAILEKRQLPNDSFLDSSGNITTNPNDADAVLPFGGAKGYALCYAIEILTGAFVGAKMGKNVDNEYDLGFLFIVLSPNMFTDIETFKNDIDVLASDIKNSKPLDKNSNVRIPGEKSEMLISKNKKAREISVDSEIIERIHIMSKSLNGGLKSNNKIN